LVAQIGDKPFLLGDKPTAGDFFIGYDLLGASYFQLPLTDPILAAYYERLSALPSFKKTYGLP
jgi:glutathione S-transferase